MKSVAFAAAVVLCSTVLVPAAAERTDTVSVKGAITLTGCVAKAKNGYVITGMQVVPGEGTEAPSPNAIYWLTSGKMLKGHVGERVEVFGEFEGVRKQDGKVVAPGGEVVIRAQDGKTVRLDEQTAAAAQAKGGGIGVERQTYKVTVKDVKRIEGVCAQ